MSQAKVDRYKAEKKVRKQTVKRAKVKKVLIKILIVAIFAAFIAWVAFSAYKDHQAKQPMVKTEVNTSALDQFQLDTSATAE